MENWAAGKNEEADQEPNVSGEKKTVGQKVNDLVLFFTK